MKNHFKQMHVKTIFFCGEFTKRSLLKQFNKLHIDFGSIPFEDFFWYIGLSK